jgi:hypothetical protein
MQSWYLTQQGGAQAAPRMQQRRMAVIEVGNACGWGCTQKVTTRNRRYFVQHGKKVYCKSIEACARRKAKVFGAPWDRGLINKLPDRRDVLMFNKAAAEAHLMVEDHEKGAHDSLNNPWLHCPKCMAAVKARERLSA